MAALDFPSSPTLNQQYAAPNGVTYQWDGAAWIVSGGPPGQLWTASGATLTPTDATKTVSVPGGTAGAGTATLLLGSNTAKARLQSNNAAAPAALALTTNRDAIANTQDDATKVSWQMTLNSSTDNVVVQRQPAAGSITSLLTLDNQGSLSLPGLDGGSGTELITGVGSANGGNLALRQARGTGAAPSATLAGDLFGQLLFYGWAPSAYANQCLIRGSAAENWTATARGTNIYLYTTPVGSTSMSSSVIADQGGNLLISGAIGQKASGTTWANPSDPRLKTDVAAYAKGLAEICGLAPVSYHLKADPTGPLCYGLDASQVQPIFPECVGTSRMKLDPADDVDVEVLTLDVSPMIFALLNAVKELAARVTALEAARA